MASRLIDTAINDYAAAFQNAVVADGNGTAFDVSGCSAVAFQATGIGTATLNFEGSIDGTNYVAVKTLNVTSGAVGSTAAGNGVYYMPCAGFGLVRCRISGWSSGTVTVVGRAVSGTMPVQIIPT